MQNNPTPPQQNSPSGLSNNMKIVLGLVIALLGTSIVYLLYQNTQLRQENEVYAENKQDLEAEIKQLDDKIAQMQTEIESKDLQLDERNRKMNDYQAELDRARRRIEQMAAAGKIQAEKLQEYQGKVDQMAFYIQKYQIEIERLTQENTALKNENQNLNTQVKAKDSVVSKYSQENTLYKTKLQAAQILKAVEYQYFLQDRRGKDSPARKGNELSPGRSDKLKICFNVLENEVAEPGKRTLYVVIKGPDGNLVKADDGSSGYFTYNGQEVPYSCKTDIDYNRTTQRACVLYAKPEKQSLAKGTYRVNVYTDGFEIGYNTFVIR